MTCAISSVTIIPKHPVPLNVYMSSMMDEHMTFRFSFTLHRSIYAALMCVCKTLWAHACRSFSTSAIFKILYANGEKKSKRKLSMKFILHSFWNTRATLRSVCVSVNLEVTKRSKNWTTLCCSVQQKAPSAWACECVHCTLYTQIYIDIDIYSWS